MFVSSIIRKFIFLTNSVLEATAMKPIVVFKFTFFILLHIFLCSRINLHKYGEKVKVVNWFITVLYIFCTSYWSYWTIKLKTQVSILWKLETWSLTWFSQVRCLCNYNQFHNILRLFDVLPSFPFTARETMGDYYS